MPLSWYIKRASRCRSLVEACRQSADNGQEESHFSMAFSLFSKPTNKSKGSATPAKSPAVDVRPANDSKRPEPEPAKAGSPEGQNASRNNNSTLMLGVSRDWRPAYSKIEVEDRRSTLCAALE